MWLRLPAPARSCGEAVVARRRDVLGGAECESRDRVVTSRFAAELWYRRNAYVAEELRCMLEGRTPQCDTLATLKQLFVNDEYPRALHPFYLLYFALQEISAGEETYHWPGATAENIHRIIEDAARNFLAARP